MTDDLCFTILRIVHEFGSLSETNLRTQVVAQQLKCPSRRPFHRLLKEYTHGGLLRRTRYTERDAKRWGTQLPSGTLSEYTYSLDDGGVTSLPEISFGMHPYHLIHAWACSEALFQIQRLWPGPSTIHGPAKLVIWDEQREQPIFSPDGLLVQSPEQAWVVEYDWTLRQFNAICERNKRFVQLDHARIWEKFGLSCTPGVLFLYSRPSQVQLLNLKQQPDGAARYAFLSIPALWQAQLLMEPFTPSAD